MAPRLDFSNWWAKDTYKGNPVVVTMENPNFSVVVLKKISSHRSSNGKGERDQIEGKARERERERERERNHLCSPPPLVFVPIANNMQPRWVRTHNCFFFLNLFWLLIPLVWREKLCFVIWLGFVFCSDCDFVVHWENAEILYAMLNFFFYSSCLILLVEEKEMKKMRECVQPKKKKRRRRRKRKN